MAVQRRGLTVVDRTIIELRRRDGWSIRLIARELGRSSGTICDEIGRHGDAAGYLAATAEADAAASRRRSGRKPRLMPDGALFVADRIDALRDGLAAVRRDCPSIAALLVA